MVAITNIVRNKCCICEREIPPENNPEARASYNFNQGDIPLEDMMEIIYFHDVCYTEDDGFIVTAKGRAHTSASATDSDDALANY